MNLQTSKTILKVFGIIGIIFGILGVLGGIAAIAGGALIGAGVASAGSSASEAAGVGIALLGFGGLVILVSSVVSIIEGYCSVKASKDISKIMPAWVFALIGIIFSVIGAISTFMAQAQAADKNVTTIISTIIGVLINLLIFVAANNIKKAAGK